MLINLHKIVDSNEGELKLQLHTQDTVMQSTKESIEYKVILGVNSNLLFIKYNLLLQAQNSGWTFRLSELLQFLLILK